MYQWQNDGDVKSEEEYAVHNNLRVVYLVSGSGSIVNDMPPDDQQGSRRSNYYNECAEAHILKLF